MRISFWVLCLVKNINPVQVVLWVKALSLAWLVHTGFNAMMEQHQSLSNQTTAGRLPALLEYCRVKHAHIVIDEQAKQYPHH